MKQLHRVNIKNSGSPDGAPEGFQDAERSEMLPDAGALCGLKRNFNQEFV